MKEIKKKLNKFALVYNVINILSLCLSLICYFASSDFKYKGLIFVLPCFAILISIFLSFIPLLEKNVSLSNLNFKTYQKVNLSISITFTIMQISLLCLLFSIGFNAHIMICIALGVFMMTIGNELPKVRNGSFVGLFFLYLKDKYQAWRKFVRLAGFIYFISGIGVIIISGVYKSYLTYINILVLLLAMNILLYILSIYYKNKYKNGGNQNEMED